MKRVELTVLDVTQTAQNMRYARRFFGRAGFAFPVGFSAVTSLPEPLRSGKEGIKAVLGRFGNTYEREEILDHP